MNELWAELELLCGDRLPLYAIAAVVLLLFVVVLLRKRQPKQVVAYTTESGSVTVSRSAIVDLVQSSCAQLEAVYKPSVKIKVKGRTTHFKVQLKLASGGRLRDIEHTLQAHLRNSLSENLGIEHLGKIDIVATGFKAGKIATSALPAPAETADASPCTSEADASDERSSTRLL